MKHQRLIRGLSALLAFLFALCVLVPTMARLPHFGDEAQYAWSAAYFGGKIVRLDFSPTSGPDSFVDPSWAPDTFWALTQPMGTRYIFSLALGLSGLQAPELPYAFDEQALWMRPGFDGPAHRLAGSTLIFLRAVAVLCAALGLALIAFRLGPWGLLAVVSFLLFPNVPHDLGMAYAEGPLVLGFGLCIAAYGTRLFGTALGLAASFKLTALGLWPLMLLPRANGQGRYARLLALLVAPLTWTILTPTAWFGGGPFYLWPMLLNRQAEYVSQSAAVGKGPFGLFFPTRYELPVELGLALLACLVCRFLLPRLVAMATGPLQQSHPRVATAP